MRTKEDNRANSKNLVSFFFFVCLFMVFRVIFASFDSLWMCISFRMVNFILSSHIGILWKESLNSDVQQT
jgi:hypothetical protein